MALVLKLGDLDFSSSVKLQKDAGFDPAGGDWREPQFSESSLAEGGEFTHDNVKLKQLAWPLLLSAASKDDLIDLVGQVNREPDKPGQCVAEWRDDGASRSSFFDVEAARLDIQFDFWRAKARHIDATLRIWVKPYAHTGTTRLVASARGSGMLVTAPIQGPIEGDVPALVDASTLPGGAADHGVFLGLSLLPHPSYAAEIRPAQLASGANEATLFSTNKLAGSQYLSARPAVTPNSLIVAEVRLGIPSHYVGRNRLLGLFRVPSQTASVRASMALHALDGFKQPVGPTLTLSQPTAGHWNLYDLGVFEIPDQPMPSSAGDLEIRAARVSGSATSVETGGVFVLPEDQTVMVTPGASFGGLSASTAFRLNGVDGWSWHMNASGAVLTRLDSYQRGRIPRMPVPSPAQVAVFRVNQNNDADIETQNNLLDVRVSIRERFSFARD